MPLTPADLLNPDLRDAMRLTQAASDIVTLGGMFPPETNIAAALYCDEQATTTQNDGERAIFHAIAAYLRTQARG